MEEVIWRKKDFFQQNNSNYFSEYPNNKKYFKTGKFKKVSKNDKCLNHVYKPKFKWNDGQGRNLTAGGILPYDDKGIWVIGEKKTRNGQLEYTDPGGKYRPEDGDIYFTISREVSEETYHSLTFSRETMLYIKDNHEPTYVNGHLNTPVYICYVVHIDDLKRYGINIDPILFANNRKKIINENPGVPIQEYYSSEEIKHIKYSNITDDIKNPLKLSHRLKMILKYGPLSSRIYNIKVDYKDLSIPVLYEIPLVNFED